jgi:hypothetical protein
MFFRLTSIVPSVVFLKNRSGYSYLADPRETAWKSARIDV